MSGSAARVVPVALVGLGGVGAAILSQLSSPPLASKFKVVAIANSKKYLFNKDGGIKSEGFLEQLNKSGVELDVPGLIGKLSTLADGEFQFHPKRANFGAVPRPADLPGPGYIRPCHSHRLDGD